MTLQVNLMKKIFGVQSRSSTASGYKLSKLNYTCHFSRKFVVNGVTRVSRQL